MTTRLSQITDADERLEQAERNDDLFGARLEEENQHRQQLAAAGSEWK